jgi:hypothetical protein
MPTEHYALVPVDDGRAIRTIDGALPLIQAETFSDVIEAFEPLIGRPIYLRVGGNADGMRLRVFDAGEGAGVRLDDADPAQLVPEPLQPALARCLDELRGADVPEQRAAWARPGWHAQAEAWAEMPLEQVRLWPLSAVLRNGDVWFKACCRLFRHEPAITQALGEPRVLRVDHERAWMLMEHLDGEQASDHHGAIARIGEIHREWTSRVDEALALGAQDRRRPSDVPHTLLHGDFHPWNVIGGTIVDWSDFAVGNPMYDVVHYMFNVEDDSLLDTYAEAAAAQYDVRAAVREYEAETYEDVALSYRRITNALAPDERWWFEDEEALWLGWASDVRAGRRPNRGT